MLVITKLDDASDAWEPHTKTHSNSIENHHERFLEFLTWREDRIFLPRRYNHALLRSRFVWSLENKPVCLSIILLYKIVRGLTDCPFILQILPLNKP